MNADHHQTDRLWKVGPIISSFIKRCEEQELKKLHWWVHHSIQGKADNQRKYQGEAIPEAVKVLMFCGTSGIIYIVYQGSTTLPAKFVSHDFYYYENFWSEVS